MITHLAARWVHSEEVAAHGFASWLTPSCGKRYCCRRRIQARSGGSRTCSLSQDVHEAFLEEHLPDSAGQLRLRRTAVLDRATGLAFPGFDFALSSASAAEVRRRTKSLTRDARCFAFNSGLGRTIRTAGADS